MCWLGGCGLGCFVCGGCEWRVFFGMFFGVFFVFGVGCCLFLYVVENFVVVYLYFMVLYCVVCVLYGYWLDDVFWYGFCMFILVLVYDLCCMLM